MKEDLKEVLKKSKENGTSPSWLHSTGFQLLCNKHYIDKGETVHDRFTTIADTLSRMLPSRNEEFRVKFFNLLWEGKYSASTPSFINIGKPWKGMPIACSGSFVGDSVDSFYTVAHEIAMLSKNGFGTSTYIGDIRPRGSSISAGGTADGVVPIMEMMNDVVSRVSQGSSRRGSVANYIPVNHGDFDEVIHYVTHNPKGNNLGWCISDKFIEDYFNDDPEAIRRHQEMIYLRMLGKGYMFFTDRTNRQNPQVYKDNNLVVKASNLCSEVTLYSDENQTFTCCLGSLNLAKWKDITDEDIETSIVLLDCINTYFIHQAYGKKGLDKAVEAAEYGRPVGLGVMGLGTYFQQEGMVFDSLQAQFENINIFKRIQEVTDKANKMLGGWLGEPELMEGTGLRCSHLRATAPTLSTAVVLGVSSGIEPVFANAYIQESAAGDLRRASPMFAKILKDKENFTQEILQSCIDMEGSVQHFSDDVVTQEEKGLLKTAFEVNQFAILRMADQRAKFIDQAQSVNLFLNANTDEKTVGDLHRVSYKCKYLKSLYYIRGMDSKNSVIKHENDCESCSG
jgi:ribonucleoside-diphosphate reductase alpha chain